MLWTTWAKSFPSFVLLPRQAKPSGIATERPQVQPKPLDSGLRLTGDCGKERTGFPQAGGAYPSEIPHPVDPEIWKR
jgi:hypothetical protein